jgi:hypothetical protein
VFPKGWCDSTTGKHKAGRDQWQKGWSDADFAALHLNSLVQNRAFQVSAVSHSFRADVMPPHLLYFVVDS